MSQIKMRLTLVALGLLCLSGLAHAQEKSLLDPVRLGVGLSAYRDFEVGSNAAGTSADWRVALPLAWEITSVADPNVKHPISLIASVDRKILGDAALDPWRFKVGIVWGLKQVGK